jgi:hypothetical protein
MGKRKQLGGPEPATPSTVLKAIKCQDDSEKSEAIKCQDDSEKSEIAKEFGLPDDEAVSLVKSHLGLSKQQAIALRKVLCTLKEEALLVIKTNPLWRRRGGAAGNAILDAIAVHNMPGSPPKRRDDMDGCRGWIFQFSNSSDINPCRAAIMALHPNAFAVSDGSMAAMGAAGVVIPANIRAQLAQPLGQAIVVNKVAIARSDVLQFPFFFH